VRLEQRRVRGRHRTREVVGDQLDDLLAGDVLVRPGPSYLDDGSGGLDITG
jgi:hypothetical protein